jgi:hypothetical protein
MDEPSFHTFVSGDRKYFLWTTQSLLAKSGAGVKKNTRLLPRPSLTYRVTALITRPKNGFCGLDSRVILSTFFEHHLSLAKCRLLFLKFRFLFIHEKSTTIEAINGIQKVWQLYRKTGPLGPSRNVELMQKGRKTIIKFIPPSNMLFWKIDSSIRGISTDGF